MMKGLRKAGFPEPSTFLLRVFCRMVSLPLVRQVVDRDSGKEEMVSLEAAVPCRHCPLAMTGVFGCKSHHLTRGGFLGHFR